MTKDNLINKLPFRVDEFMVRKWNRNDVDLRCEWPSFPSPYEEFDTSMKGKSEQERDEYFGKREYNDTRLVLTVEHEKEPMIATFGLVDIDWNNRVIGNMGIRLHPHWCDKGYGTKILNGVKEWCFGNGFNTIKLDVINYNKRAIRCYEKTGFVITSNLMRRDTLFYVMECKKTPDKSWVSLHHI